MMNFNVHLDKYLYFQYRDTKGKRKNICIGQFDEKGKFYGNENLDKAAKYMLDYANEYYHKAHLLLLEEITRDQLKSSYKSGESRS